MISCAGFCANGIFNLFPDREEICRVNIVSTEEPKVRMSFMLAPLLLFCQEICTEKIKVRENFFKTALFELLRKVINNDVELVAGDEFENSSSEQNSSQNIDSSGRCDAFMEDLADLPTCSLSPALVHEDIWATKHSSPKSPPNNIESPPKSHVEHKVTKFDSRRVSRTSLKLFIFRTFCLRLFS